MGASTIRISESAREVVRELADRERVSMQTVIERAVEDYRRNRFLDAVNATFAELRGSSGWAAELKERDEWETTISDSDDGE